MGTSIIITIFIITSINTNTNYVKIRGTQADLVMVIMFVWEWGSSTIKTFIFKDGKSTYGLSSNDKMGLKLLRTS